MLTETSFEIKKGRQSNFIEKRYYCEINIYVTAVSKAKVEAAPLYRPKKNLNNSSCHPTFSADELYSKMLNPTVESRFISPYIPLFF
jgi:hypothetical protein